MYEKFFGLRESPFRVNPDPRYLFLTPGIQEALASLAYGIRGRRGIILLTGEVGTGKTTLLNMVLDWLRQNRAATAFIFNTHLTTAELFECLMGDLGISCESRSKSEVLMRLNRWLLERYSNGQTAVLIVDEAQSLSDEALEEIRFLTNLETSTEKLLQVVLSGQPELEERLRQPHLRQLRQRITVRCRTNPLSLEETQGYIAERLRIAGASNGPIFSPEAVEGIYRHARGIPRVINVLCEHALISAFADQEKMVTLAHVEGVAHEFELDRPIAPPSTNSENLTSVEKVLRDLSTVLERMRQPVSVGVGSGKESYEPYP
ncbi:MAG: AAA family ATPase [Acidobacteria bacterium]|nr:MAG: AAA family ATPase [Acidobacteriota bacterium]